MAVDRAPTGGIPLSGTGGGNPEKRREMAATGKSERRVHFVPIVPFVSTISGPSVRLLSDLSLRTFGRSFGR